MNPLWLILLPVLPLVGFAVNGLIALATAKDRRGASTGMVGFIAVTASALTFIITLIAYLGLNREVPALYVRGWEWLPIGINHLSIGLQFDRLTAMMLLFITGIGTLIHLYSIGYMRADRGFARFMAYLNLFMASMIILVLGDSLVATFLGWEGVGLCSYLLIGFWKDDHANNDAARKAFIMNRVGDLGFILGAFFLWHAMGDHASLRYVDIAAFFRGAQGQALAGTGLVVAACALFFFGCTGKSAQIPLLTWLPDAMAGPTPVSALIHAATMVTSGVYLCARLADVFVLSGWVMPMITVIGLLTAFFGAIAGLVQWDIKKVLAYSTVSQLGFMFMAVGVGAFDVALFHVFTHAFFKATLFLGAGSIIHSLHHEQDMRRMGGLQKLLPITYPAMFFGWWAITGMPLGSGFMSKDLILERLWTGHLAFGSLHVSGQIVSVLALVAAFLTAIYMSRLMYLTFWSPSRRDPADRSVVHEAPFVMSAPVLLLGFGALVAGTFWIGLVPEIDFFSDYLRPILGQAQETFAAPHEEHGNLPKIMASVGVIVAILGWVVARLFYRRGPRDAEVKPLHGFADLWTSGIDRLYQVLFVLPTKAVAWVLSRVVDQALLGGLLRGLGEVTDFLGEGYTSIQRSRLRVSLAMSLIGAVLLIAYLIQPFLGT